MYGDKKKRKNKTNLISLRKQIMGIIFWFCVILAVVWIVGMMVSIQSYQKKQEEERMLALQEYAEKLDDSIMQLNDAVGNIFMSNNSFIALNQYKNASEEVEYTYDLLNLLNIQVGSNKNISGLFIYYSNLEKVIYCVNENMSFQAKEILKNTGKNVGDDITFAMPSNKNMVYVTNADGEFYYNVYMKKTKAAIAGCISLGSGIMENGENGAAYAVVYKNKAYVTKGEQLELSAVDVEKLQQGKNRLSDCIVYMQPLGSVDMAAVEILPITVWLFISPLHMVMCGIGIISILLALKINRLIAFELLRPLEDMNQALTQLKARDWKVQFEIPNRIEEIENVRSAVKVMLEEIEQYKIKVYEEQLEKQEIELQYLRLQLAPHFYTNCLKNAYYMLMLKEYENVEKYLLCLSTHLRYLLQKNVMNVTLREERDFVLNYIELQKLMTEKEISMHIQIDEKTLNVEVPLLLLQTFVENSIKYGWKNEQNKLILSVRVRQRKFENGECLDIHIGDNGAGYPEKVLKELNGTEVSKEQKFGVGIINLQHRMKLQYGGNVSWYFDNEDGAISDLLIPINGGTKDEGIID